MVFLFGVIMSRIKCLIELDNGSVELIDRLKKFGVLSSYRYISPELTRASAYLEQCGFPCGDDQRLLQKVSAKFIKSDADRLLSLRMIIDCLGLFKESDLMNQALQLKGYTIGQISAVRENMPG
jgi:hypothetical protein